MAKKADEAKNAKLMDDRAKALETTLASLEKQFGKGTVMKLGEQAHMKVDVVPTGCLELDLALGVGGIPKGRIIEIYGPESSGKTTVALHIVAESQKRGGIAATESTTTISTAPERTSASQISSASSPVEGWLT